MDHKVQQICIEDHVSTKHLTTLRDFITIFFISYTQKQQNWPGRKHLSKLINLI